MVIKVSSKQLEQLLEKQLQELKMGYLQAFYLDLRTVFSGDLLDK